MRVRIVTNPFGEDWLDKLKEILPTIGRLNISTERFLIDANRKALFITGYKNLKWSRRYLGVTKISLDGNNLRIQTLAPGLVMGIIGPLVFIVVVWILGKSVLAVTMITLLLIWSSVYWIRDNIKQDKFTQQIKNEIEML